MLKFLKFFKGKIAISSSKLNKQTKGLLYQLKVIKIGAQHAVTKMFLVSTVNVTKSNTVTKLALRRIKDTMVVHAPLQKNKIKNLF